jgi:hypothetical protein
MQDSIDYLLKRVVTASNEQIEIKNRIKELYNKSTDVQLFLDLVEDLDDKTNELENARKNAAFEIFGIESPKSDNLPVSPIDICAIPH